MTRLAKNKMALLRIHRIQRKVAYNTQNLRRDLMKSLKELFDFSNATLIRSIFGIGKLFSHNQLQQGYLHDGL